MLRKIAFVLALLLVPAAAQAQARSQKRSMSFESCLETIRKTARKLGIASINVVETNILRIVRFNGSDGGSVLVTCSRPDRKMVITLSPPRG